MPPPPQLPSVNVQYALTSTTSGFTVVGETMEKRDVKLSSERGRSPGTPREKGSPGLFADGKKRERLSVYGRAPRCYQIHRSNVFSFHHSQTGEGVFLGSFLASSTFGHNNRRMLEELEEWQEIFGGVIFAYSLFGPPCRNCASHFHRLPKRKRKSDRFTPSEKPWKKHLHGEKKKRERMRRGSRGHTLWSRVNIVHGGS